MVQDSVCVQCIYTCGGQKSASTLWTESSISSVPLYSFDLLSLTTLMLSVFSRVYELVDHLYAFGGEMLIQIFGLFLFGLCVEKGDLLE